MKCWISRILKWFYSLLLKNCLHWALKCFRRGDLWMKLCLKSQNSLFGTFRKTTTNLWKTSIIPVNFKPESLLLNSFQEKLIQKVYRTSDLALSFEENVGETHNQIANSKRVAMTMKQKNVPISVDYYSIKKLTS